MTTTRTITSLGAALTLILLTGCAANTAKTTTSPTTAKPSAATQTPSSTPTPTRSKKPLGVDDVTKMDRELFGEYADALEPPTTVELSLMGLPKKTDKYEFYFAWLKTRAAMAITDPELTDLITNGTEDDLLRFAAGACDFWDGGKSINELPEPARHDYAIASGLAITAMCPKVLPKFLQDVSP